MSAPYISRQISVFKNNRQLIELLDSMNVANVENYAHIHATKEEDENGIRRYSRIGVVLQDYSKGTGDNCIRVKANLKPEEIKYLYHVAIQKPQSSNYPPTLDSDGKPGFQTKIFGDPDKNGRSRVTMFRVARQYVDKNGEIRELPWLVSIQNGTGIKVKNNKTGGSYMKSGSYEKTNEGSIFLSDHDFFFLLSNAVTYINAWEMAFGVNLVRSGIKAWNQYLEESRAQAA